VGLLAKQIAKDLERRQGSLIQVVIGDLHEETEIHCTHCPVSRCLCQDSK
jgi:hypothetical protein